MRGKTKLVSLATILAVLLTVSIVFASGFVDVSTVSVFSAPPFQPDSPGSNEVFVDPDTIIKDYLNDPGYAIGSTFVVHVNVTDVTDLFCYQVNVTWDPDILNFTGISAYGDFLYRTASPDKTSRIEDIYVASNETGYATIAETILGDVSGITGSGRLFTIEFLVVGYGSCKIGLSELGPLPVLLLDSTGASIAPTPIDGYFKNKLTGDANGDGNVNSLDIGRLNAYWSPATGTPPWSLGYSRDVDTNDDGYINSLDIGVVNANWGRTIY